MSYAELKALAAAYPPQPSDALSQLADEYHRRHEREILDLAAIAADVSVDDIANLGLEPEANTQILEAFSLQYPNVSIDSIVGATGEQLRGWTNGVKGKYFEVLVAEKLNDGESICDIQLAPGEVARVGEIANQPGWDIQIIGRDGDIVEQVQLKATDSMSYVKSALEKYPDIRIVAPQELEGRATDLDDVISTDITNESLENTVGEQLSELSEDAITDIFQQSAEAAFDAIPGISAALIGVTEAGQVLMGRSTVEESLKRGGARLGRSSVYTVIGAGLTAVDAGIISVPTVMALRVAEGRVRHRAAMGDHLEEKTQEILLQLQVAQDHRGSPNPVAETQPAAQAVH